MSEFGKDDKTGLSPQGEGGKGRKKSSRKTNGRFTESDQQFPFDEETMKNPRMKFDKWGNLRGFNTTGEPSCNSYEIPPPWYPCPLRNPSGEDLLGDREELEGNRCILRDWLRDPGLNIWSAENWVQDETTGYPLYLGPKEHGYPIYVAPKKKKRTSKPKRDSLEGQEDLKDGGNDDSLNAKKEEQPAVGDPRDDPNNYAWEFDSNGELQADYKCDDGEGTDKGDSPQRSKRAQKDDDDSSEHSVPSSVSIPSNSSLSSRTKEYRARELEKKRVRDLSDERFIADWDRDRAWERERAESRERKREKRSRSRDNVRHRRFRERSRSRSSSEARKRRERNRNRVRDSHRSSDSYRSISGSRSLNRDHRDRYERKGGSIIAASNIAMLNELSERAIDSWYSNILTVRAGRVEVNHLVYINPSLLMSVEIMTELNVPFTKERGHWRTWSLSHLVKVLKYACQAGRKAEKHVAQIDALKALSWVQSPDLLSLIPLLNELNAIRRNFGIQDFDLNEDMLRSLTAEIRRQLMSDKVAETHQKYNKSLADHMKNVETKDRKAFNELKKILVVIGNFNESTRNKMADLQEIVGKLQLVSGGKSWGTKGGGGNQDRSSNLQKGGGQGKDNKEKNPKKPRFEQDDSKPACKGCGRNHDGECTLKHHPNWNHTDLPWKESINGKRFKAVKDDSWPKLPEKKMLTREGKLVSYERLENFKVFSINLNNTVNNEQAAATFEYNPTGLIDSGALFGGPYVDKKLADKLFSFNKNDFKIINTNNVKINVPFNGMGHSNTSIDLCIELSHKSESLMINETFIIVKELGNDIIIDEDTIKKYKLTRVFDDYFTDKNGKERVRFNICDCNSCETCLEPRPAGAGSTGIPHPPSIAAATLELPDSYEQGKEYTEVHISDIFPPEDEVDDGLDHETFMDNIANKEAINDSEEAYKLCTVEAIDELFRAAIWALIYKYRMIFRESLIPSPAFVEPMVLKVEEDKWRLNKNKEPRRLSILIKGK